MKFKRESELGFTNVSWYFKDVIVPFIFLETSGELMIVKEKSAKKLNEHKYILVPLSI